MLYLPMSHRQRVETCRTQRTISGFHVNPPEGDWLRSPPPPRQRDLLGFGTQWWYTGTPSVEQQPQVPHLCRRGSHFRDHVTLQEPPCMKRIAGQVFEHTGLIFDL